MMVYIMGMKSISKHKNSDKNTEDNSKDKNSSKNVIVEKEEELICPMCGSKNVIKDYERAEIVCANCGCVLQQNLFDVGPEWRAFDHEQRVKRSRVGAPMTYSVDYNEPIIINEDGNVKIVKIGQLIDSYIENSKEIRKDGILEIANIECKNLKVASFDCNYKFKYMNVSEVSRHPVDEIYNIVVEGNKHIKTTGSHSVFSLKNGEVIETRVDELKEGDYLVLAKKLPNIEYDVEINIKPVGNYNYSGGYSKNRWGNIGCGLNLQHIKSMTKASTVDICGGCCEYNNFELNHLELNKSKMKMKMNMDEQFTKLLAYYTMRRQYSNGEITIKFGKGDEYIINDIVSFFKKYNITYKIHETNEIYGTSKTFNMNKIIKITDKSFIKLLLSSLNIDLEKRTTLESTFETKKSSNYKRIPSIIYLLPKKLKIEFLKACINCNGYIDNGEIIINSPSEELLNDLMILLLQLGIISSYGHLDNNTNNYANDTTNDTINNNNNIEKTTPALKISKLDMENLENSINLENMDNQYIYNNIPSDIVNKYKSIPEKLEKLVKSDFIFLKIKKIEKTEPTNGYAYDLTVPNAENFVAGYGAFVLHNTIHDKGLSTVIDWRNKDSYGKDISADRRAQLYRLRKWQRRIRVSDASERNLAFALSELDRIASKLGLPRNVRENAAVLYRGAVEKGLIRGRSIEGVAAAALYAACRRCKVPRTLDEIAEISRVDRKEIGRTYRFISRELNIRLAPTNPIDYVPRFASELKLPGEVESKAIAILQKASERGLTSGRGPTGVAAAAIYIASVLHGTRRTQREVAEVAGVTEVTIRNRYKELTEYLDIDVTL